MIGFRTVDMAPAQARYALGYACVCAWAVILLIAPVFGIGSPAVHAAPASMLPGLITCLASLVFTKQFPSIAGRTGTVALSALLMAGGTLLCTFPATSSVAITRFAGLALSGLFAIVLIMAWFDVFARLKPRAVIVLAGCTITLSALMCWGILSCDSTTSSVLVSLLPMLSFVVLPASGAGETIIHAERVPYDENPNPTADRSVVEIVAAALPIRTLIGLAITFFIMNLLGMLAPAFGSFSSAVSPISLLVPLGVTAFFIASAFVVRKRIDPSILFKILMFTFAALVLLLTFSIGINASLVFYAYIIAEVVMWAVLALLAKKTPVRPHHVFAVGWIAECAGSSLGQVLAPLFIGQPQAFFAVALMLILAAVGFAFSEGSLMLDVGFEDEGDDQPKRDKVGASTSEATGDGAAARMAGSAGDAAGGTLDASGVVSLPGIGPASGTSSASSTNSLSNAEAAAAEPSAAANTGFSQSGMGATSGAAPASGTASTDTNAAATAPDPNAPNPLDAFVADYDISPRERDVLELWLAGRGLKYIENTLFISESTVKSHLRSIYRKCDTHNRDEIISLYESRL